MKPPRFLAQRLLAWRTRRRARRALRELFDRADLQKISSLRPEHRQRAVLLSYRSKEGKILSLRFGMVRHPKPLRVPFVHNDVIEIYHYDLQSGTVTVLTSHNLTRRGRPGGDHSGGISP